MRRLMMSAERCRLHTYLLAHNDQFDVDLQTNPWLRIVHPPKLWLNGCLYLGVFLPTMFSSKIWPSGFFTSNTLPLGAFSLAGNSLPAVQSINVAAGPLVRQT